MERQTDTLTDLLNTPSDKMKWKTPIGQLGGKRHKLGPLYNECQIHNHTVTYTI